MRNKILILLTLVALIVAGSVAVVRATTVSAKVNNDDHNKVPITLYEKPVMIVDPQITISGSSLQDPQPVSMQADPNIRYQW